MLSRTLKEYVALLFPGIVFKKAVFAEENRDLLPNNPKGSGVVFLNVKAEVERKPSGVESLFRGLFFPAR